MLNDNVYEFEVRIKSSNSRITEFEFRFYDDKLLTVELRSNTRPLNTEVTIVNNSSKSISLTDLQDVFGGDQYLSFITNLDLSSGFEF